MLNMKFVLLAAVSLASAMAQYGVANDNTPNYGSVSQDGVANGYGKPYQQKYPHLFINSHYYFESHETPKKCPNLRTFLPTSAGILKQAFYPPIIRYMKQGRHVKALVVCDANPKTINILIVRRNSSRELKDSHIAAIGTTAAQTLSCDRDEERYFGNVLNLEENDFNENVAITQVACLRLDRTVVGRQVSNIISSFGSLLSNTVNPSKDTAVASRKKREANAPIEANTEADRTVSTRATGENTQQFSKESTTQRITKVPSTTTETVTKSEKHETAEAVTETVFESTTASTTEEHPLSTTTTGTSEVPSTTTETVTKSEKHETTEAVTETVFESTTASTTEEHPLSTTTTGTSEIPSTTTENVTGSEKQETTEAVTESTTNNSSMAAAASSETDSIPNVNLKEAASTNQTVANPETAVAVFLNNMAQVLGEIL